jgi:hypothetical protein
MIDDFRLTIDDLKNHLRQYSFFQSSIVNRQSSIGGESR